MSKFQKCRIAQWNGRYTRIAGRESIFHLKSIDGEWWPTIIWYCDDSKYTCLALEDSDVRQLAKAVAEGKLSLGGNGGGSFHINEFGQILVPASDGSGNRVIVGEWHGKLLFENPGNGQTIDLSDDKNLECGDKWQLPYLGMKYQLHRNSRIYFYRMNEEGGQVEYAKHQDQALVKKLRSIRRSGPTRFVVNPFGIVLTRRPAGKNWSAGEEWESLYVGRLNPKKWFKKEV